MFDILLYIHISVNLTVKNAGEGFSMWQMGSSILPDEDGVQDKSIENVSQYIDRINEYIGRRRGQDCICVYRGEPDNYPSPCRPNIFRRNVMSGNKYFEKNLFDSMRQNKLTGEKRYLDNAIDAQHGEFPSRLLDVSYNCLTALYFAVTPYYHYQEVYMDDRDGMVFVFFVDEIFSPSSQNINDNYDAIINRDQEWYQDKAIFRKNHKFIDHTKLNNRIVAQQGAFILFPGDIPESLSPGMGYGILIPREAKPGIRKELKTLFGIHTGNIYPEIINLVSELSDKSRKLNTDAFNCKNELCYALKQMEKELDYYLGYAIDKKQANVKNMEQIMIYIERVVDSYRKGLIEFIEDYKHWENLPVGREELKQIVEKYNQIVKQFSAAASQYVKEEFSEKSLRIELSVEEGVQERGKERV